MARHHNINGVKVPFTAEEEAQIRYRSHPVKGTLIPFILWCLAIVIYTPLLIVKQYHKDKYHPYLYFGLSYHCSS